jgi:tetratricopeptide (TPR) repeat protein
VCIGTPFFAAGAFGRMCAMNRVRTFVFGLTALTALAGARVARADNSDKAFEHRSRGRELESSKNLGAALVEYRTALRLDPKDAEASWRAGVLELKLGHAKVAIPLLEQAVRGSLEADGAEEIDLAGAYEKVGRLVDARRVLEGEIGANPSFIRVRLSLVSLLARHGACAHAREVWAQAEHEPSMHKKEVVSFADDARQEMATRCEMPPPKHVATR